MVDVRLLFAARSVRLFAYGLVSVVLALYLTELGLSERQIGWLLTLTLVGDTAISLGITTRADRRGRRRMLVLGAALMVLAGIVFASTRSFVLLLAAAVIGVLSPSGGEIGPFLSVEQAALAELVPEERRTAVFAWYNLAGAVAAALGSLCGGLATSALGRAGLAGADVYRPVVLGYGALGLLMAVVFCSLSRSVETERARCPPVERGDGAGLSVTAGGAGALARHLGIERSGAVVGKLAALFSVDAFAGGLVLQSLLAWWLHLRFGLDPAALGVVFLGANLLAGASSLAASALAARFGLVNTMVFTHLPSNVLLILVPLMPSAAWAVAVLLLRFSISQMDVPTRQAYVMAVVPPAERSAAAGVTTVARSLGTALSPALSARWIAAPALWGLPFFVAGGLKILYDLALYRSFSRLPESTRGSTLSPPAPPASPASRP